MKCVFHVAALAGVFFGCIASAQGGLLLSQSLVIDGTTNSLKDNSVSTVFSSTGHAYNPNDPNPVVAAADAAHQIGAGDIVVGTLRINFGATGSVNQGGINTPKQLAILFSAQIVGVVDHDKAGSHDIYTYNLAATPTGIGPGLTINELLHQAGSNFAATTFDSKTIFAVLESQNAASNNTQSLFTDVSDFNSGHGYTLDFTGGLVNTFGGLNAFGSTDFFQASLDKGIITGTTSSVFAPPTIGQLAAFTVAHPDQTVGFDSGAFTMILNNTGITFGTVNAVDQGYDPIGPGGTDVASHTSNVAFAATLLSPTTSPNGGTAQLGYSFADSTQVSLRPLTVVPEPSSMVALAGLVLPFFLVRMRRAKKSVA